MVVLWLSKVVLHSIIFVYLQYNISSRSDLSFNLEGYTFVLLNDIFTAANGVYTKQKMDPKVTEG